MIFKKDKTNGFVRIIFPEDFERTSNVCVVEDYKLPDTYTWIWSLFYAKTLQSLGTADHSNGLKEMLEQWASENIVESLKHFPHGYKSIDPEIRLIDEPIHSSEEYSLLVIPTKNFPSINTRLPKGGFENRMAYSVIALAEYIATTRSAIALPSTILYMKEFYSTEQHYSKRTSVLKAPMYAMAERYRDHKEIEAGVERGEITKKPKDVEAKGHPAYHNDIPGFGKTGYDKSSDSDSNKKDSGTNEEKVVVRCPECRKKHALPAGKSGTVACRRKSCGHRFHAST